MKRGMSKPEAVKRVANGEFTWEDLRQILVDVHPTLKGEAGKMPSRVNKTLSLACSFNIHWRAIRTKSGKINTRGDHIVARNILRDFGKSVAEPRVKKAQQVHHAELIDIHKDDPPILEHWIRNDSMNRWESNNGKWFAYDQWSCGRLTQMRPDRDTEDDPAWNEIYAFARSRPAGRVDDGRNQ